MICSMSNVGGGGGESSLQIQFLGIDAFKVRFFVFMDAFEMHLFVFMKQSCNKVESRPIDFSGSWPDMARERYTKIYLDSWGYCCS
jgi:hypothetical protein